MNNEKPSFTPWAVYNVNDTIYYYNKLTQSTTSIAPNDFIEWLDFELNATLKRVGSVWRRYKNEAGRVYYHNKKENATQWDIPPDVLKYQKRLEHCTRDDSLVEIHQWNIPEDFRVWMIEEVNQFLVRSQSNWKCVQHKDGRLYFYDKVTRNVQWNKPDGVNEYEKFLTDLYVDLLSEKLDFIKENNIKNSTTTATGTGAATVSSSTAHSSSSASTGKRKSEEMLDTDEQADRVFASSTAQRKRTASELDSAPPRHSTADAEQAAVAEEDDYYNDYFYASDAVDDEADAGANAGGGYSGERTPEPYDSHYESEYAYGDGYDNEYEYGHGEEGGYGDADDGRTPVHGETEPYGYSYEEDDGDVAPRDGVAGSGDVNSSNSSTLQRQFSMSSTNTAGDRNAHVDNNDDIDSDYDPTIDMSYEQLEKAKRHSASVDCLMDRNISETLQVMFSLSGEAPLDIVKQVCNSYTGYAQMTLVVLELMKALEFTDQILKTDPVDIPVVLDEETIKAKLSSSIQFDIDNILCTNVADIMKQRFDRVKADALINRLSGVPVWLTQMIQDPIFRRALIEMYEANRSSTLLGVCLREISALGHHRDISRVIRDVEYFDVFSNMIIEILVSLMLVSDDEVGELASDWRRMNCHSEYMFLFSNSLLERIEQQLLSDTTEKARVESLAIDAQMDTRNKMCTKALRRIRRLRQETESEVVWEKRDGGAGRLTSTAIMALRVLGTFSETNPYSSTTSTAAATNAMVSGTTSSGRSTNQHSEELVVPVSVKIIKEIIDILKTNTLLDSHIQKLFSLYFNTAADSAVNTGDGDLSLQQLQYFINLGRDGSKCISFLQKPQLLALFVDGLVNNVRPLNPISLKMLVKLLAMGTSSLCNDSSSLLNAPTYTDEQITATLLNINSITKELSSMVDLFQEILKSSFGVIAFERVTVLCDLLSTPIVSICTLRWMILTTLNTHYSSKTAYLTVLPVFFQLITIVASRHSYQLPECFDVIKTILTLSSNSGAPDDFGESVSFQIKKTSSDAYTLTTAQKDAMEILVYMMGLGYTLPPLDFLLQKCEELDAVTLRHTLQCILASIKPPFSVAFLRRFEALLLKGEVKKAISSSHFKGADDLKRFYQHLNTMS